LELDDRLGEAYAVLARIQRMRNDFESAEATFQRALELNPNYAFAYFNYGRLLRDILGRPEEALTLHRRGVELDPLSAAMINQIGQDMIDLGRFDEGLSWYEKSLEADPGFPRNLWAIGVHHWLISGDYGEAVRWLRKAISSDPGDVYSSAFLGRLFIDLGDPDQAEHWIHRSIELGPGNFIGNLAMQLLYFYRDDSAAGMEYGRKALATGASWALQVFPVQLIGNDELKVGRYSEARALYEKNHPELLNEGDPKVEFRNYRVAIDLASVLFKTGEEERANLLLNRSSQHIETVPRLSWSGYGISDVKIYAIRGDKQKALSALRQAIDEGWRSMWWYFLKQDPTLESLYAEPEFQAMVAEIEADMATQLARVREMERNGELEPIPELAAE
jgi:tetratricopeptide (TPR) repeat protein